MSDRYGRRPAFSERDWRGDWSRHYGVVSRHSKLSSVHLGAFHYWSTRRQCLGLRARCWPISSEGDERVQALAWLNGAVYSGWLVI